MKQSTCRVRVPSPSSSGPSFAHMLTSPCCSHLCHPVSALRGIRAPSSGAEMHSTPHPCLQKTKPKAKQLQFQKKQTKTSPRTPHARTAPALSQSHARAEDVGDQHEERVGHSSQLGPRVPQPQEQRDIHHCTTVHERGHCRLKCLFTFFPPKLHKIFIWAELERCNLARYGQVYGACRKKSRGILSPCGQQDSASVSTWHLGKSLQPFKHTKLCSSKRIWFRTWLRC